MRNFSAILLIAVFFFNLFGYRLLFQYHQQQSDKQLEASLDKNDYNEADLVIMKIPLSLPYMNNQQDFERVDGEITINGKILKYVKRKISDGNLVLMCLPDHGKMGIESAKEEFFKYANDLVQNSHSKKSGHLKTGIFKNLLVDSNAPSNYYAKNNESFKHSYNINSPLNFLPSSHQALPEQPPDEI